MLRRIYVLILAVVVAAIVASGASAFFVIKSYHSQVSQEYLYNAAQLIEQRLVAGDDFVQAAQAISRVYQRDGESIRVTIIQTDGTVVYDNFSDSTQMENHLYRPEIRAALQNQGVGFASRTSETIGQQMLYLAIFDPALALVVRTSISYDIERSGYLGLMTTLVVVAGLSMVALLVIGYLALRQITRPLVELKQAANQVQQGDYQIRVGSLLDDKSELTDLGNAFNAMARQLSQTIQDLEERNT
ncbi:MAG: HAMP domain-containing protein, partial [Clostridia bacterium]|nr:HAMP domain-containing protein [Clostridia bacterium]